jgi:phosphoribosylformylglycinamidine cyclo-ligase
MAIDYKEAGVNIELGDDASKILYNAAKLTFENRKGDIGEIIVPFDDFSGVRAIDVGKLPKGSLMCLGFDGIGTKVEIAQRMKDHTTIAFDLFAMVCDDAVVRGAEPVLIGSVLDVNSLGTDEESHIEKLKQIAEGYIAAAKAANVAVINGELAELGDAVGGYGKFKYNWCSGLVWFAAKDKLFIGKEIQAGDYIVVLEEKGFRANGLSLARLVFGKEHGNDWHTIELDGKKLGRLVLEPSTIYSKAVVHMHGGFQTKGMCEIHGVAHITGGGIPGKLGRVLRPSGLGAELIDLFSPCKAMQYCQKLGGVSDEEAYRTWNMGQGMAIITPEPEKVISEAEKFGIKAKTAGRVVLTPGIHIKSKGVMSKGEILVFSS